MFITKVKLNNFRCFQNKEFDFEKKLVIIQGDNGSGKTSLLEAIHYACYLRSFRTRLNKEIVSFDFEHFFLQINFDEDAGIQNQIQVGHSNKDGKLVKFNQKQIQSYKDIILHYRIISVTEDDLQLVQGAPEFRRSFLNQSLFLLDPNFLSDFRQYKQILDQRNNLIAKNFKKELTQGLKDELFSWTKQLWEKSQKIQKDRIQFLLEMEQQINELLKTYFANFQVNSISLKYICKNMNKSQSFDKFLKEYEKNIQQKELRWGRSLFGAHLDDFSITFSKIQARVFASRGQQKLILCLLKIVQLQKLQGQGESGCLLLDDFLTDFDFDRLNAILFLLKNLNCQVFITCPLKSFVISKISNLSDFQVFEL